MHFVDAKGILSAQNGMNIYRGCTHGCIYCDSRSTCYQFTHDFEDIEVKQNAPELLERALKSKRRHCMIGTGSMSDPYMIYEAKLLGASAVLLIMSILDEKTAGEYLKIADSLGLSALVETHNDEEVKQALNIGARIIGVNNRNLKDFTVDTENSRKLRQLIPSDVIFVSESGVSSPEDVKKLRRIGADAVLVGETLMRAEDKTKRLSELKGL